MEIKIIVNDGVTALCAVEEAKKVLSREDVNGCVTDAVFIVEVDNEGNLRTKATIKTTLYIDN